MASGDFLQQKCRKGLDSITARVYSTSHEDIRSVQHLYQEPSRQSQRQAVRVMHQALLLQSCTAGGMGDQDVRELQASSQAEAAMNLTEEEVRWLRSLVRMQIRKTERTLEKLSQREGQAAEDYEAFAEKQRGELVRRRETLEHLS